MSGKTTRWKRFKQGLHIGVLSLVVIGAGVWLTLFLFSTLGWSFSPEAETPSAAKNFDRLISLTNTEVVRHLGEWSFSEPKLKGHFHHIGRWYTEDKWDFCVDCHGPTAHSRGQQVRALLNMHTLFISCNVCHVRETEGVEPTRFGWMRLEDGSLRPNPDIDKEAWGEYGAKITQVTGPANDPKALTLHEERDFAAKLKERREKLDKRQKVVTNKVIHKRCMEKPIDCTRCHGTNNILLPYEKLGYTEKRAAFLMSPEVVDLVKRYQAFYMSNLLEPTEKRSPRVAGSDR